MTVEVIGRKVFCSMLSISTLFLYILNEYNGKFIYINGYKIKEFLYERSLSPVKIMIIRYILPGQ